MLYIAYVKARAGAADSSELEARSRKWWNEGARPEGLKTIGIFGCLGTESPDIFVFDAGSHDDIQTIADIEVHPAMDLAASFRQQGMNIV